MVKVGFICEGATERLIIESDIFKEILTEYDLEMTLAIDAKGNGNLLPHNIEKYIAVLEDLNSTKIIILTDLDYDNCITLTKQRINARDQDIIVVAVREIEAWFLADNITLSSLFKENFHLEFPEIEIEPYDTLNNFFIKYTFRGNGKKENGGKIKTAKKMLNNGFSIKNASDHLNCNSAKYFLDKLRYISLYQKA